MSCEPRGQNSGHGARGGDSRAAVRLPLRSPIPIRCRASVALLGLVVLAIWTVPAGAQPVGDNCTREIHCHGWGDCVRNAQGQLRCKCVQGRYEADGTSSVMAENPGCPYWAEHIRFDDIVAYGAVLATFNLLTALLCAWGLRLLVKQERLGLNMQTCATLLVMAASLLAFIIHTVNPYAARNTIPAPWNLIMTYLPDGLNLSAYNITLLFLRRLTSRSLRHTQLSRKSLGIAVAVSCSLLLLLCVVCSVFELFVVYIMFYGFYLTIFSISFLVYALRVHGLLRVASTGAFDKPDSGQAAAAATAAAAASAAAAGAATPKGMSAESAGASPATATKVLVREPSKSALRASVGVQPRTTEQQERALESRRRQMSIARLAAVQSGVSLVIVVTTLAWAATLGQQTVDQFLFLYFLTHIVQIPWAWSILYSFMPRRTVPKVAPAPIVTGLGRGKSGVLVTNNKRVNTHGDQRPSEPTHHAAGQQHRVTAVTGEGHGNANGNGAAAGGGGVVVVGGRASDPQSLVVQDFSAAGATAGAAGARPLGPPAGQGAGSPTHGAAGAGAGAGAASRYRVDDDADADGHEAEHTLTLAAPSTKHQVTMIAAAALPPQQQGVPQPQQQQPQQLAVHAAAELSVSPSEIAKEVFGDAPVHSMVMSEGHVPLAGRRGGGGPDGVHSVLTVDG